MKIKHSKFRNTGLIFELLVKQIAADTLNKKDSPAVQILKKYYSGNSLLGKEYKLYEYISKSSNVSQSKAEAIVSTITEVSKRFNQISLKKAKYDLISEIKEHYNIDEFFAISIANYKPFAALYCLLEAQNNTELVDPSVLIDNKTTILEHLTNTPQIKGEVKGTLVEEYSKYDKDLKLLIFKILLEKYNTKYKNFLPEQKHILKEFITSVNSQKRLLKLVNEEIVKIVKEATNLRNKVEDSVIRIKLDEVLKSIKQVPVTSKIKDKHVINLLQYYELLHELKQL